MMIYALQGCLEVFLHNIKRTIITMVRIFDIYRPFRVFGIIGAVLFGLGFLLGLRFLYFYLVGKGNGNGHVQSLTLVAVLLGMGFQNFLVVFLADLWLQTGGFWRMYSMF